MTPTPFGVRSTVEGLTVVGESAREAPPEIVELSFEIHSVGLTAGIALQENTAKATQIGQALAAIGNALTDMSPAALRCCRYCNCRTRHIRWHPVPFFWGPPLEFSAPARL